MSDPASCRFLKPADLDTPHRRPFLDIGPGKLLRIFGLQLVIEWLRIVIVDQHERCARRQLVDELENLLVALRRNKAADVDLAVELLAVWVIAAPQVAD